jgi:soluble lytic murein transglycosylase
MASPSLSSARLRAEAVALLLSLGGTAKVAAVEAGGARPTDTVSVPNPAIPPPLVTSTTATATMLTEADLAPYLAGVAGEKTQTLLNTGHYREALPTLQKLVQTAPVRYLEAISLLHLSRFAEAAPRFAGLAGEEPALADRCHLHAAVAYEELDDREHAEAEYQAVSQASVLWSEARLGLTRVRRQARDYLGALEAVAPLANRPSASAGRDVTAEGLVLVAQLADIMGDKDEVKAADLRLWAEHPLAKVSEDALAQAKKLGLKDTPLDAQLTRAELLEEAHHNVEAMKLLQPLVKSLPFPSEQGCRARFVLGKSLRKERQHAKALDVLGPVIESCTEPSLRARALYVAASSASIVAPIQGVAYYEILATDYPAHAFADDALFFAADLEEKAGRLDSAVTILTKLVDTPAYREGDFRADGLFRLFWIHRLRNEPDACLAVLDRILNEYGSAKVVETERAEYWRARTLLDQGKSAESGDALEALARAHPTSYYALLARSQLATHDPERVSKLGLDLAQIPGPAPLVFRAGRLGEDAHFRAALELHRLGFFDDADDELLAIPRDSLRSDLDSLRLLVQLLSRSGATRAAQQIARTELTSDLTGPFTPVSVQTWLAAYPLAFRPQIQRTSGAAHVEPDLFQALVREESALDPRALSWAGAVGLSQLMIPTAREVARQMGIKTAIDAEALMQPDLNLALGSTYVGQLLRRFNGNPALALAAYNAGAGAVNKWLNQSDTQDLDAFVEEIPIAETRGYVKRVLQSYNVYQLLYARSVAARVPQTVSGSARPSVTKG